MILTSFTFIFCTSHFRMATRPGIFDVMVEALRNDDASLDNGSDSEDSDYVPSDVNVSSCEGEESVEIASKIDSDDTEYTATYDTSSQRNIVGKDGMVWSLVPPVQTKSRQHNIVRGPLGVARNVGDLVEVKDAFYLFLDDNMINDIVLFTNKEGLRVLSEKGKQWKVSFETLYK
jgi:hypothetical protein